MDLNKSRSRDWKKNPPRPASFAGALMAILLAWGLWASRAVPVPSLNAATESGVADGVLLAGTVAAGLFILAYIFKKIVP